jgi:hypothetical protein
MQNCLISQPRRTFSQTAMATAIRESGEVIGRARMFGKVMLECVVNTWAKIPVHRRCRVRFSESLTSQTSNCHRGTVMVRA